MRNSALPCSLALQLGETIVCVVFSVKNTDWVWKMRTQGVEEKLLKGFVSEGMVMHTLSQFFHQLSGDYEHLALRPEVSLERVGEEVGQVPPGLCLHPAVHQEM